MALDNIERRVVYEGDGSQKDFPFSFVVFKDSDITVSRSIDDSQDETVATTEYSVELSDNGTGTVHFAEAPAEGVRIAILSAIPETQPMRLTTYDGFDPEVLNDSADRIVALIQQLLEQIKRTITVPPTSPTSPQELFYQLLNAAKEALDSAQSAEEALAACEQIRQLIEQYSWDIPHIVDSLRDVENYPYDGLFAVAGFGNAGGNGQNISNRYVKAEGSTELRTLGERFSDVVNVRDFGAVGDGVTDDTEVFQTIESKVNSSTYVNLLGLTFYVTELPVGAKYFNGTFKYNGNLYTAEYSYLRNGSFFFAAGQGAANSLSPYAYRADITAIGRQAGYHFTNARNCIAIGEGALFSTTGGRHNIAIGNESLYSLKSTSTGSDMAGTRNTAIGGNAGHFVTSGSRNVILGRDAGHSLTTGTKNVIIGNGTLLGDCPNSLDPSVVINQTPSNATSCVIIGTAAGRYIDGVGCVAIGENALLNAKALTGTTAIGYQAGQSFDLNISPFGTAQTEVSIEGTYSQTGTSAITITTAREHGLSQGDKVRLRFTSGELGAITFQDDIWFDVASVSSTTVFTISTDQISTASGAVAISLIASTEEASSSVSDALVIGYIAGRDATSAIRFTALGSRSGTKGGNYSTYVGAISGNVATGSANTAVGASTLASTSGGENTAVGYSAGASLTSGGSNTLIGRNAGETLTTGQENTALGTRALDGAITVSSCVALGAGALRYNLEGAAFNFNDCAGLGANTRASGDHQVQIGNSAQVPYAYAALQLRSDERDKTDIRDTQLGSDFILALRPVDFKWNLRDDYIEEVEDGLDSEGLPRFKTVHRENDGSKKRTRYHHGFIAQEVKAIMDDLRIDFGGYQDHRINGGQDVCSLGYEELIAPMVKTIQELAKRIETLEKRVIIAEAQ